MYKGEVLEVTYIEENKESKDINIDNVIEQIECKFKYLNDETRMKYYNIYTNALARYYSLKVEEGEKELIDLLIEMNELVSNLDNDKVVKYSFVKSRNLNNK